MTGFRRTTLSRVLLGLALAAWAVTLGCPAAKTQERPTSPTEQSVQQLQQDADLLREINRLDLNKDKLRALIAEVEALQARMKDQQARRDAVLERLKPHLEAQKAALLKDEPVPEATTKQIQALSDELQEFNAKADQELATEFSPRVHQVLSQEQIDILTWVSEARLRAQELLDWAREMSDADFKTDAAVNAQNLAEGRTIGKDKILEVFQQARAMSPDDYAKGRAKLADQLIPATRDDSESVDVVLIRRLQPPRLLAVLGEKLGQVR